MTVCVSATLCALLFCWQPQYDQAYTGLVKTVTRKPVDDVLKLKTASTTLSAVAIEYSGLRDFAKKAQQLGIMTDEKAGVPRTAYKGVVETWREDLKVYLVPKGF